MSRKHRTPPQTSKTTRQNTGVLAKKQTIRNGQQTTQTWQTRDNKNPTVGHPLTTCLLVIPAIISLTWLLRRVPGNGLSSLLNSPCGYPNPQQNPLLWNTSSNKASMIKPSGSNPWVFSTMTPRWSAPDDLRPGALPSPQRVSIPAADPKRFGHEGGAETHLLSDLLVGPFLPTRGTDGGFAGTLPGWDMVDGDEMNGGQW